MTLKENVAYGKDLKKFYAMFDCQDFAKKREEKKIYKKKNRYAEMKGLC